MVTPASTPYTLIPTRQHVMLFVLLYFCVAPMRHFELAFKMFDLNGDGDVELKEFEKV